MNQHKITSYYNILMRIERRHYANEIRIGSQSLTQNIETIIQIVINGLSQVNIFDINFLNQFYKQVSINYNIIIQKYLQMQKEQKVELNTHNNQALQPLNQVNLQNSNFKQSEKPLIISPHKQAYDQFMKDINELIIEDFSQQFRANNIMYHPSKFYETMYIQAIKQKIDGKMVDFKIGISYFTIKVKVYNDSSQSKSEKCLKKVGKGAFGSIFQYEDPQNQQNLVFKNIKFQNKSEDCIVRKGVLKAFEQYSLFKLASCFKIGPKISNQLGFDLIIYNDSIEFMMERCLVHQATFQENFLKQQLKLLHQLNIVHGDIKSDNIMYSPKYKKNILIDFNCGSIVNNPIGYKTYTHFKGTPQFCYEEMKQLFNKRKNGYADLYFNDIYALQKIRMCPIYSQYSQKYLEGIDQNLTFINSLLSFYKHIKLRFLFFNSSFQQLQAYLTKNQDELTISSNFHNKFQQILEDKQVSEEVKSLYNNKHSEIISLINQTVSICSELTLNNQINKMKKLLKNFFSKWIEQYAINQNEYIQSDDGLMDKLVRFTFRPSIKEMIDGSLNECRNVIYILLNRIFSETSISKSIMIFYQMIKKQAEQEKLKDLYYILICSCSETQFLELAIRIFQKKDYVKFSQNDTLIQKMCKIDEHYNHGKMLNPSKKLIKKQYNINNQPPSISSPQNIQNRTNNQQQYEQKCKQQNIGLSSYIDVLNFSQFIEQIKLKRQKINPKKIQIFQLIFTALQKLLSIVEIQRLKQQYYHQMKKLEQNLIQILGKQFIGSQYHFILNFLKFIFLKIHNLKQYNKNHTKEQLVSQMVLYTKQNRMYFQFQQFLMKCLTIEDKLVRYEGNRNYIKQYLKINPIYHYQNFQSFQFLELLFYLQYNNNNPLQYIDLKQQYQSFDKYIECQHCRINNIYHIFAAIMKNISKLTNYKFIKKLLEKSKKYYCLRNVVESKPVKNVCKQFNRAVLGIVSILQSKNINQQNQSSDEYNHYLTRFIEWLNQQYQQKWPLQCYVTICKYYYQLKNHKKCWQYSSKALEDNYSIIEQQLIGNQFSMKQLKSLADFKIRTKNILKKTKQFKEEDNKNKQFMQFYSFSIQIFSKNRQLLHQAGYFKSIYSFIEHMIQNNQHNKLINVINTLQNNCQPNQQPSNSLIFYLMIQIQIYRMKQIHSKEVFIIELMVFVQENILQSQNAHYVGSFEVSLIFLLMELAFCWRKLFQARYRHYLFTYIQASLFYILKNIPNCIYTIRNRIKQNIIPMVFWLNQTKNFISKTDLLATKIEQVYLEKIKQFDGYSMSSFLVQKSPIRLLLKKINYRKLAYINFRKSLPKTSYADFPQLLKKILPANRFTHQKIRTKIRKKLKTYLKNKYKKVQIPRMQSIQTKYKMYFQFYLNSQQPLFLHRKYEET